MKGLQTRFTKCLRDTDHKRTKKLEGTLEKMSSLERGNDVHFRVELFL